MAIAFVLINVQAGAEQEVLDRLKRVEGVKEAYAIYGIYDILIKLDAETLEKVKEAVDQNIRKIGKVRSSLTMFVMEKWMQGES